MRDVEIVEADARYGDAGLENTGLEALAPVHPVGHSRRTLFVDLICAMRPQILALGAAHAAELDELDAAAREHLDDSDVIAMPSVYFLSWGRKPAVV
jgi:hypothetical protein